AEEVRRWWRAAAHDGAATFRRSIDEAGCGDVVEETATVFAVDRARSFQMGHRRAHDAPECWGLRGLVDGDEVGFLVEEHATGSQRGEHPPERLALVGKPLDQPARVHQVEAGRQVLDGDVVPQHLQGRGTSRLLLEEVRLQVGCDDLAIRNDVLAEPKRDRAATRADLETPAARPNTEAKEMRTRPRAEPPRQAPD